MAAKAFDGKATQEAALESNQPARLALLYHFAALMRTLCDMMLWST